VDADKDSAVDAPPSQAPTVLVYVVSSDVKVKDTPALLALPERSSSDVALVTIVPKREGMCELTFLVTESETLDLLQTYTAKIKVHPPPQ
jgi:hypothetical protein